MNSSLETCSLPTLARCYPAQLYLLCRSARRSIVTRLPAVASAKAGHSSLVRANARGFTLVELLVVITIIIVLVSMLFPAFRGIQDQAKRTQAKNDLNQITTAISAFYTEYGRYPVDPTITNPSDANGGTFTASSANNYLLFDVLRNDISRNQTMVQSLNPRQIVFIEPPIAKDQVNPKLGICTGTTCAKPGVWYDPWGYPYNITLDANYNAVTNAVSAGNPAPNYTDLSPTYTTATDSSSDRGPKTGAIAWTMGPDNALGNNGDNKYKDPTTGVQSDDVISWQ
jgi:prepilin-type N-terminal cleavage/methylation domain-containing protein